MLNGKSVSIKSIIAKVYRDLQLQDEEQFMDIIEWAAEALEFIGVYPQYESKPKCFELNAYKTELPCDFVALDQISYNGVNMRASNNSFGLLANNPPAGVYLTPYSYNQAKIENAIFVDPNDSSFFRPGYSFKIEHGWLKTSFNTGEINMVYVAQPMDEEGYPLVPDHQSFKEALYWFIVYKTLYPRYLQGQVTENAYQDAWNKWQWYCNQAGAQALMPDLTTLDNIKRSFLSLKPRPYLFDNFYNSL